ncbi:NUDIX domain-containing protein [Paraburkholderia sp. 1N]|uniref:NUDIX domain-containing protein n=1 Tax=Paraburkholderia solitsugae TaxID=2675748 RepID=A0ABX2C4R6_9BURK|nr:NUDIX domain-containing protein [Paraburkholderia solitsugae]NPT48007.1 NUDIX domain-containing protein [Paraburkholderia solitsugae]
MKDRSTIVSVRAGKVLLVARARSRWSLPGGTIKRSESPLEAARRELEEETSLVEASLTYLFQFGGLNKRHHVFSVDLARDASPEPGNEISQCHWFSPIKVATLSTSIPTREIVDLFLRFENRRNNPSTVLNECDSRVYADGERITNDTDF